MQNVVIRECHIPEYRCSLYTDTFAAEMKFLWKRELFHVDGTFKIKLLGKIKKKGDPVFAEKEANQNAVIIDCFSVAWEGELKVKLTTDIIDRIPKDIFSALSFFKNHGDKVTGSVYSLQCFPSPMSTRSFEVLINCNFKTEASKLKLLEHLKDITERNCNKST